jgi:tRNA threonylcarbamoyladenosine biosynthesis protein TsaB
MPLRLLALDTATETVHLALTVGDEVCVRAVPGGAQASAALLPAMQQLVAEAGIDLREIDAFAFGRGPGSFTGLRTACAVVQGLASGAARPVIAIDTLMAVAEAARLAGAQTSAPLWAATDARMGEVYAARYAHDGSTWQTARAAALYTPEALALHLREHAPCALAGNAARVFEAQLAPAGAALWPQAEPHGAALANLARAAFAAGRCVDPAEALPLYVRDKVALTTAERDAARRAEFVVDAS